MLLEFLSWWAGQLTDLARYGFGPGGTTLSDVEQTDALLVIPVDGRPGDAAEVELIQRRRGATAPVGRFALDRASLAAAPRGRVVLSLGERPVLAREVALPLAAEKGLQTALRFEMDRLTPFQADDVFWDCRMLRRDRARGVVMADLAVVPKAMVAPVLAALRDAGLEPAALEGRSSDGRLRRIELGPATPERQARQRRVVWIAAATCAVLATAVVVTPLVQQSLALQDAEDQIAALRPRMGRVDQLRHRLAGDDRVGAPTSARAHSADTLTALATVTDLLPDDTSLAGLSLQHGRLRLEGLSAAATRLIGALSDDPHIRNPGFVAPVVRGEGGSDVFSIEADFVR